MFRIKLKQTSGCMTPPSYLGESGQWTSEERDVRLFYTEGAAEIHMEREWPDLVTSPGYEIQEVR